MLVIPHRPIYRVEEDVGAKAPKQEQGYRHHGVFSEALALNQLAQELEEGRRDATHDPADAEDEDHRQLYDRLDHSGRLRRDLMQDFLREGAHYLDQLPQRPHLFIRRLLRL